MGDPGERLAPGERSACVPWGRDRAVGDQRGLFNPHSGEAVGVQRASDSRGVDPE